MDKIIILTFLLTDGRKLAERLQAARSYQSAAMKRGIECEVIAAQSYSKVGIHVATSILMQYF